MTFRRTNDGLSNSHLFLEVDYIVYVEGKKDKKQNLEDSEFLFDKIHWSNLFDQFSVNKIFKFEMQGSKTELESISHLIVSGEVDNIIICMDSDYDSYYEKKIIHDRILYTHGYSWENDICAPDVIINTLARFISDRQILAKCINEYTNHLKNQKNTTSLIGRIDIALQKNGKPLQDKEKIGELIKMEKGKSPNFCKIKARNKLISLGYTIKDLRNEINIINYNFIRHYHGKTVFYFTYQLLQAILKNCGCGKFYGSNVLLISTMMNNYMDCIRSNDNIVDQTKYYKDIIFAAIK